MDLEQLLQQQAQGKQVKQPDPVSVDDLLLRRSAGDTLIPAAAATVPVPPVSDAYRFFRGVKDPVDAGAQLAVHSLPDGVVNWVNQKTQAVNDMPVIGPITKALGMTPATAPQIDSDIQNAEKQYQAGRQSAGNDGVDWMRLGGNITGSLPAMATLPAATTMKGAAGLGAVLSGLTTPVNEAPPEDPSPMRKAGQALGVSDFAFDKGKQAALGGAASGAIGGVARLISPYFTPNAQKLADEGISNTLGRMAGGASQRIEDGLTSIPVLGDVIKNAQRRGMVDLNRAAINRSLDPIGEELPKGLNSGHDAIAYANGRLRGAYTDILDQIGAIKVDPTFKANVNNLNTLVQGLPEDTVKTFKSIVDRELMAKIDKNGVMTSDAMKGAESNLGDIASRYGRSEDYNARQLADAVYQLRAEVRDMVARKNPDYAEGLRNINKGWANYKRVEAAAATKGADEGTFSASQLQSAVRALDDSKDKGAFGRGEALMQDLSGPAFAVQGSKVPNSGTPFRHAVMGLGAGLAGHSVIPGLEPLLLPAAAGVGVASIPYTKPVQALLSTARPDWMKALANRLIQASPAIAPAGAAIAPTFSH